MGKWIKLTSSGNKGVICATYSVSNHVKTSTLNLEVPDEDFPQASRIFPQRSPTRVLPDSTGPNSHSRRRTHREACGARKGLGNRQVFSSLSRLSRHRL